MRPGAPAGPGSAAPSGDPPTPPPPHAKPPPSGARDPPTRSRGGRTCPAWGPAARPPPPGPSGTESPRRPRTLTDQQLLPRKGRRGGRSRPAGAGFPGAEQSWERRPRAPGSPRPGPAAPLPGERRPAVPPPTPPFHECAPQAPRARSRPRGQLGAAGRAGPGRGEGGGRAAGGAAPPGPGRRARGAAPGSGMQTRKRAGPRRGASPDARKRADSGSALRAGDHGARGSLSRTPGGEVPVGVPLAETHVPTRRGTGGSKAAAPPPHPRAEAGERRFPPALPGGSGWTPGPARRGADARWARPGSQGRPDPPGAGSGAGGASPPPGGWDRGGRGGTGPATYQQALHVDGRAGVSDQRLQLPLAARARPVPRRVLGGAGHLPRRRGPAHAAAEAAAGPAPRPRRLGA